MRSISISHLCVGLVLLCALAGCQQRAASKLQGRWEGRPDSVTKRAERDAEKYGDQPDSGSDKEPSDEDSSAQVTDWESYDVTIVIDFVSANRLEMSLDGGQAVTGQWKILSTTPSGCTIEVESEAPTQGGEAKRQRRRFELLLDEREGTCVGFQLTEAGADAQLGALYFQRQGGTSSPAPN
ncbi:MAG: hypothetical protein AAGD11_10175 [Planctomycetota bacterium]